MATFWDYSGFCFHKQKPRVPYERREGTVLREPTLDEITVEVSLLAGVSCQQVDAMSHTQFEGAADSCGRPMTA